MYRKLRGGFASDEGMSVLEVVLAAFILFFVLTAVLGLVATTTRMGLSARQRTAMTNAVSSHLEWIRSLEFEQMAITGTTPDGAVDSQTVMTVDGFTITIDTAISQGSGGNTREISISATADAEGFTPMSMTTFTAVRDWDSGIVMFEEADGPEVKFNAATPADGTVVYSRYTQSNAPLYLNVTATAAEDDGVIAALSMYCADTLLRDGVTTFANFATWQPNAHTVTQSFHWNTQQVGQDESGQTVATIDDGWRLVRILAEDGYGAQGLVERRFYVDNFAPENPGIPTVQVNSDTEVRVGWAEAQDGTGPALEYDLKWWPIGETGVRGTETAITDITTNAWLHPTAPFSRYSVAVAASSPRNLKTPYFEIAKPYVSRATASGTSVTTYTGRNNRRESDTAVSLSVTEPTFAVSSVRYDVYRSLDPATLKDGTAYATNTGPNFEEVVHKAVGRFGSPDPYYYAFKVTYTPSGYAGGTSESVWSDVIGPLTELETTQPMEHYSW